jgi:hypothetical protein
LLPLQNNKRFHLLNAFITCRDTATFMLTFSFSARHHLLGIKVGHSLNKSFAARWIGGLTADRR